mgnify:CR=1 FL=1
MRSLVFGIILSLFSLPALSQQLWHSGELERIYPHANGSFVITFKTNHPNCSNQSEPKYHYVKAGENGVTPEGVQSMLSVALAAFMADKALTIKFDDTSTACFINRLFISNQ